MVEFVSSSRIQKYKIFCINHNFAKNYFSFHKKKELNKFSVGNRFLMSIQTFFVKKNCLFFFYCSLFAIMRAIPPQTRPFFRTSRWLPAAILYKIRSNVYPLNYFFKWPSSRTILHIVGI